MNKKKILRTVALVPVLISITALNINASLKINFVQLGFSFSLTSVTSGGLSNSLVA
jgi:hypothetical protein